MKTLRAGISYLILISVFAIFVLPRLAQLSASAAEIEGGPQSPLAATLTPGPAIVGGTQTTISEFPWQAAIMTSNGNSQYCGGSLVAAQWVLSAAHCFVDENTNAITPASEIGVALGRTNWTLNDGQFLMVNQLILHPDYLASNKVSGDLALLKLAQAAALNADVQVIPMATTADAAQTAPGVTAWVTGWGNTTFGGTGSDVLLKVDVPIVANQACIDAGFNVIDSHLCAGGVEGKDSCQGDSGGPLAVPNAQQNGWLLAGVVSYGPANGCGLANIPGVYERVSSWANWVNDQIGGASPTPTSTNTPGPSPTATNTPVPGQGSKGYLPYMSKGVESSSPTATPTPGGESTPTPTATTAASLPAILNPGFESGNNGNWIESSSNSLTLITDAGFAITTHAGSWLAWLGGENSEDSRISQSVTIANGAPAFYLYFYYWLDSQESTCDPQLDALTISINGVAQHTRGLCQTDNTNGWVQFGLPVDLSAYAGQTIPISFKVTTNEAILTNFYIDDVSFSTSAP
jgi:hypothetical protein